MSHQRATRVGALLLAGVTAYAGLVGCGDSSGSDETTTAQPGGGMTEPGASLALGKTAMVPVGDDGVIKLTVTSIDEGEPADLGNLPGTPYYVRMKAEVVSGDAYGFFSEEYVRAFAGNTMVPPIATPLTVGTCKRAYFAQHPAPGTTLSTCVTYAVDPGAPGIDRVSFENGDAYKVAADTAVGWS